MDFALKHSSATIVQSLRQRVWRLASGPHVISLIDQAIAADEASPGLGLTVTKKTGNSPQRNRIRRRLRAAARACGSEFLPQHDYVLVGRREALSEPFAKIVADLSSALLKLNAPPRSSGSPRP